MNVSFNGNVALVTGAGSGIDLATAKAFCETGASVILADRNEKSALAEADKLTAAGHKALAIGCDVADEQQVAAMVEKTISAFGRLDAAFNSAGIHVPAVETADAEGADFDLAIAVNLRGVWNL